MATRYYRCLGCRSLTNCENGYCDVCTAAKRYGLDWRLVYDRDDSRGAIPANLLARYPSLRPLSAK
jgi:hypothetical protein